MTIDPTDPMAARLESCVDYTDLRKTITYADIDSMCSDAVRFGFGSVVVPTALVHRAVSCLDAETPAVGSVLSYPFGTQAVVVKACEAEVAAADGATALDVVPHFGAILAEQWNSVRRELQAVRGAVADLPLTVVLETGRLRTSQLRTLCGIAAECGYAYVANTVGFRLVSTDPHAEGRASQDVIRTLHELADGSVGIKAVGGITTRERAEALRSVGAERFSVDAHGGPTREGKWHVRTKGDS